MNENLQLFASLPVNVRPRTDNEEVLKQQITLVAKDGAKAYTTSDLPGLITSLNEAGIIVAADAIYLKAKRTHVRNLNNDDIAVFNDDGSLNANLINADTITVNHLYAKSAQNGSVVGHFGNYDKSDATAGDTQCPLWLGSTTAANAPFRVTKDGAMYAISGEIAGFKISNNSLGIDGKSQYGYTKTATYLRNGYFAFYDDGYITEKKANEYRRQIILENSGHGGVSITAKDWTNQNLTKTGMLISLMNGTGNNVGLRINVSGSKNEIDGDGDHAILIENGDVAGLRLNIRKVTSSYTITNYDNIVVNYATDNNTILSLPNASDCKGQIIFIINKNDYECTIKGTIWKRGSSTSETLGRYGKGALISDGNHWIWFWFSW